MKKLAALITMIILFSQAGFSHMNKIVTASNSDQSPELTIIARSGLSLREGPHSSSPLIKIIPYGDQVLIRKDQPDTSFLSRIEWVDGEWLAVEHDGSIGFVFDGFLTSLPLPSYEAEFSPYDLELIYPLESWMQYNFTLTGKVDSVKRSGGLKVVSKFENGNRMIQSHQLGFYKSDIYLHDTRIMDVYLLILSMLDDNEEAIQILKSNSVFIEDQKGDINKIKVNLDTPIEIRKLGPDLIRITSISSDHYCKA